MYKGTDPVRAAKMEIPGRRTSQILYHGLAKGEVMPKINQLLAICGLLLAAFLVASPSLAQSSRNHQGHSQGSG